MSRQRNRNEQFEQALKRLGDPAAPGPEQMDLAAERVLQRLRANTAAPISSQGASVPQRQAIPFRRVVLAAGSAIAATLAIAALIQHFETSRRASARVELAETGLYRIAGSHATPVQAGERIRPGEILRATSGEGVALSLADGSSLEMGPGAEISLEAVQDGVQVRLGGGNILVEAAKQHGGHLYVRTTDSLVSVTGTVFYVYTEPAGSRVAVIEGEVRVDHGANTRSLTPGQQLSTASSIPPIGVIDGIAWSRNLAAHLALLQRETAAADLRRLTFRQSSISADPAPPSLAGYLPSPALACHGADGVLRGLLANADSFAPRQGRCVGNHVPLADVIAFAYDTQREHISGGPDWLQSLKPAAFQGFRIEATASDPAVTREELRHMLQTLLAERFNLKFHRETRDLPGHALGIRQEGLKLKQVPGEEEGPFEVRENNRVVIRGKSSMRRLADFVSEADLGLGLVADKTDLDGIYEYTLRFNAVSAPSPYEPSILTAFRDQLGLTLEPETIAVPFIVIDAVEKPSAR